MFKCKIWKEDEEGGTVPICTVKGGEAMSEEDIMFHIETSVWANSKDTADGEYDIHYRIVEVEEVEHPVKNRTIPLTRETKPVFTRINYLRGNHGTV